jgi:uncharacterized protein (TIGR02145 family)
MLAMALTLTGCAEDPANDNGGDDNDDSFTYQGQTYKTVKIGNQTWMAENLNYDVDGSKCYDNNLANCTTYGRMYDWATAMALPSSCNSSICSSQISAKHKGVCPSGWHIPSDAEWTTLINYVGGSSTAGAKLKANSVLWNPNTGTDDYGFSALPGGGTTRSGDFVNASYNGYFWSVTEGGNDGAWLRDMYGSGTEGIRDLNNDTYTNGTDVIRSNRLKAGLASVRCLKD